MIKFHLLSNITALIMQPSAPTLTSKVKNIHAFGRTANVLYVIHTAVFPYGIQVFLCKNVNVKHTLSVISDDKAFSVVLPHLGLLEVVYLCPALQHMHIVFYY